MTGKDLRATVTLMIAELAWSIVELKGRTLELFTVGYCNTTACPQPFDPSCNVLNSGFERSDQESLPCVPRVSLNIVNGEPSVLGRFWELMPLTDELRDLLGFIAQQEISTTLLPPKHGQGDCLWDNCRNNEFDETLAFDCPEDVS